MSSALLGREAATLVDTAFLTTDLESVAASQADDDQSRPVPLEVASGSDLPSHIPEQADSTDEVEDSDPGPDDVLTGRSSRQRDYRWAPKPRLDGGPSAYFGHLVYSEVVDMWAREASARGNDAFWQNHDNASGDVVFSLAQQLFKPFFNARTYEDHLRGARIFLGGSAAERLGHGPSIDI